jgi:hypothetical protein
MKDIFRKYRFNKHHFELGDIWLTIAQQDEMNEEVQTLLRVARAAEKQRGMLRKTRHFNDLTEIEVEIFEAIKELPDGLLWEV